MGVRPGEAVGQKKDVDMQTLENATQDTQGPSASSDTLFGICYSVGKDFGFNPFFLRIALIGLAVFSIPAAVATYLALGFAVALSRLFFPAPQADAIEQPPVDAPKPQHVVEQVREPELIAA